MKIVSTAVVLFLTCQLVGCSDSNNNSGGGDHVWKEQTDTIEKAKEAEDKIMDAAKLQREAIDQSE